MFKRILVPLDGSDLAERAVPVAARLAQTVGGTVILLRVVPIPIPAGKFPPFMNDPRYEPRYAPQSIDNNFSEVQAIDNSLGAALDYLKRIAQSDVLAHCMVEVQPLAGATAPTILSAIGEFQADIVVMCSHGYAALTRWALGSVTQKVARHCPVPVLILRAGASPSIDRQPDADHPVTALVSLDGSAVAEAALEPAVRLLTTLAAPEKALLHLFEVVAIPATYGHLRSQTPFDAEVKAREKQEAEMYLALLKEKLSKVYRNVTVTTSVVVDADIASAIIQAAGHEPHGKEPSNSPAQFIAMATYGRGGLPRWVMGSITERVLHAAPLPLLVVRPQSITTGQGYAANGKGTLQEEVVVEDMLDMSRD